MSREIIAFAEEKNGELKRGAFEVVTAARKVADATGGPVTAVVLAKGAVAGAGRVGRYGADELLAGTGGPFASHDPATLAWALAELARRRGARAVLLPASALGKDVAPRVAARLGAPLASDCVELLADGAGLRARRPVYAGKAFWTVASTNACFLASLRPNVFTPEERGGADLEAQTLDLGEAPAPGAVLKEVREPQARAIELTEAATIVSGGRGLKGPEHFAMLEELARVLGAAVGASRAVVDAGWRPHSEQVGQTGKVVAPNLYIACGISGAIQHLAGMSSSRVIVAINKDPEAPIFKVADYGIVGDVFEVVPALTAELARTAR